MARKQADVPDSEPSSDNWWLLPWDSLSGIVKVLTWGLIKYPNDDRGSPHWEGLSEKEHFAALMRHLVAWKNGESTDEETGYPTLWHAGARMLFLIWTAS